ncbi:MAG: hypothetical protein NVS4B7_00610 [Ktedonobacteraceae bacterium]
MLCTFCNTARLANETPCPRCGAPSPLIGASQLSTTPWENSTSLPPDVHMNNQAQQVLPQASQTLFQMEQQPTSRLPVPFQQLQQQPLVPMHPSNMMSNSTMIPVPVQNIGPLVPALPQEETTVYVPPMYTKPRAIIPRYRIISGLLSLLIVTILLCAGTSYYVKASGSLNVLSRFLGLTTPPNLQPTATALLQDPLKNQEIGPAYNIINSATTAAKITSQNVAVQQDTIFKTNQTIYLTYSVQHPQKPGIVVINWYTNGSFYQATDPKTISTTVNGYATQQYVQPAEGKVEIFWNGQLAIRLFFVVR